MESLEAHLRELIRQQPGLSPKAMRRPDGGEIPRQSLTRYLSRLVARQEVLVQGAGPATRYFPGGIDDYLGISPALRPEARFLTERVSSALPRFTPRELGVLSSENAVEGERGATAEARARGVREKLMVELAFASSSLEGNTYTLVETQALIEYGERAPGKSAQDARMILNHRDAIRYLLDNIETVRIDWPTIRDLHAQLSDGLLPDPADSGRIRRRAVSISGSTYQPLDNEFQIREALDLLLHETLAEADSFDQSIMLMTGLAYLQPFADCNKRTGRLMSNLPLIKAGHAPLSFVTVNKLDYLTGLLAYYELGRTDRIRRAYLDAYPGSARAYAQNVHHAPNSDREEALALRYRAYIRESLGRIVLGADPGSIAAPVDASEEDASLVQRLIARQLASIHPGRAAVIGVSPEDVARYLARVQSLNDSPR